MLNYHVQDNEFVINVTHWMSVLSCTLLILLGGAVDSWLVRSTLERVVRVRALAGDIVLCFWVRHFTLTVPLSTQVYK